MTVFQFLFLIFCGAALIIVYLKFSGTAKKAAANSINSQDMLQLTSTNNSYDPLGDVLVNLDGDLAQFDLTLHADMRGYMDGI